MGTWATPSSFITYFWPTVSKSPVSVAKVTETFTTAGKYLPWKPPACVLSFFHSLVSFRTASLFINHYHGWAQGCGHGVCSLFGRLGRWCQLDVHHLLGQGLDGMVVMVKIGPSAEFLRFLLLLEHEPNFLGPFAALLHIICQTFYSKGVQGCPKMVNRFCQILATVLL